MGTPTSGVRTWTEEQDQFIRDNRDTMRFREMAAVLGVTKNAVVGRSNRLDLAPKTPMPRTPKQREDTKSQIMKIRRRAETQPGVTQLARTSMDERLGGMGWFKQVAAVEIALDHAEIKTRPVSLFDRTKDQCCWPLDDGTFCGMPKCTPEFGRTEYCGPHHRLSVRPQSEYRKPLRRRT